MGELKITPGGLVLLGGRLCLDFCNTVFRYDGARDILAPDRYGGLAEWCKEVELITPELEQDFIAWAAAHPDAANSLFEQAIDLREAIYQLGLASIAEHPLPLESIGTLNHWVQQTMAARQLTLSPTGALDWQWRDSEARERPLWEITLSAVEVFLEEDVKRLRQCPGCGWLFYDQTKNNTRTWCDMRFCGNRAKNKRFHARQKQADE